MYKLECTVFLTVISGLNDEGQLGQGNTVDYYYPPDVAIKFNAHFVPTSTVSGYIHSCALSEDGRVACWGYICVYKLYGSILSSFCHFLDLTTMVNLGWAILTLLASQSVKWATI